MKMLQSLMVKNFAIIDNVNLEFKEGFTAITGETGAGKSLLIDAIGLLLGDRASSSMVRTGETKAIIEGVFDKIGTKAKELLKEYGLSDDIDEDLLIIKKEINTNGKSIVRINGSVVNLNQLDSIAKVLADIHTQNDTKKLFEAENYLSFIDDEHSLSVLKEYQEARHIYLTYLKNFEEINKNIDNFQKEYDYFSYQYNILKDSNLKNGELEHLEEEYNALSNFEQIYKNLALINQKWNENNINDIIYEISDLLNKISDMDVNYKKNAETLKNIYYDLTDLGYSLNHQFKHLDFDENRYNQVIERMNYLKDLIHKYRKSIPELIEYEKELKHKLEMIGDQDFIKEDAKKHLIQSYIELKDKANQLTEIRKENAKLLTQNIQSALKDLMLNKVQLDIVFDKVISKNELDSKSFAKNGQDFVDIVISFNPGESLKSLSKVASGGEMSRVMLAIKTHLLHNLRLATMIFDEIDSGVSGDVAFEVGKKLKEISKSTQVLAITHLPIVAALADQQFYISKEVENNLTRTIVTELTYEQRIEVLAKLISPNDITGKSKDLAISMLSIK